MILQDKVVLVSGVGAGLGRSIAVRCAEAGADVVLAARTEATLQQVAEEVRATGRRALAVPTDIAEQDSTENLVSTALTEFGRIDVLVNNAFAMPPMQPVSDTDIDRLRKALDVTVFGTLQLTRRLVEPLSRNGGAVVFVNSMLVRRRDPDPLGGYRMTKAALLSLAQNLATELGGKGIRVNSVAPGRIWDDRAKWYYGMLAEQRGITTEQVYEEYAALSDLQRLPEPDSVADTVAFLASDLARSVTGHCLDVNCGEHHT